MSERLIEWKELGTQLVDRISKPGSRPTAFFYLLLAVAAFGGVGLWVTLLLSTFDQAKPRDVALAVGTYALAIVFTSLGDLFLDREATRNLKFILFFTAVVALCGCGYLTYVTIYKASPPIGLLVLVVAVAPVWVTWWLINGVDQRFTTDFLPREAIGGDPGQKL